MVVVVVVDLSRVFHVIDSATLQLTHRCTPAPDGILAVPAALPTLPPIPAAQPPAPPTVLGGAPPVVAPVVGNAPDPNAALLQGVLSAIQAMTQMNIQSDLRNTSMTQQQSSLQAASMRANQMQLQHLTNHLGNLGHEVGNAIASHPARHKHTIQATLSQPNVAPGQSNDPRVLGSLTQTAPPSMSIPLFNCGPYVQAFQPQPNDKHTRRIDKATHQVVQRHLLGPVKIRYDAAHNSGVMLPASDFINGFTIIVETSVGHGHEVVRGYYWHPSFGTACITASGFMLQPNIQEQEFGCHAPSLDSLDPALVCLFYLYLCQVAHDYRIYMPAYEEF